MQQHVAHPGAGLGGTGLAGQQRRVPVLGEPLAEQPDLGGLARAVAALERDETAGVRRAPGRRVLQLALADREREIGDQRDPLAVVHLPVGHVADRDRTEAGQQERGHHAGVGERDVVVDVHGAGQVQQLDRPAATIGPRASTEISTTRTIDCTNANVRPRTSSPTSRPSSV